MTAPAIDFPPLTRAALLQWRERLERGQYRKPAHGLTLEEAKAFVFRQLEQLPAD